MSKDIINAVAIAGLISALSIYIPIIGFFCAIFLPLPILFYRAKLGREKGVAAAAIAAITAALISGGKSFDSFLLIELILLGFILGELISFQLSIEKTVLYAGAAVLAAGFLIVLFYTGFSNKDIYTIISEYIELNLKTGITLYRSAGIPEDKIRTIINSMDAIIYVIIRIIPSLLIVSVLFLSWVNLIAAKIIMKKHSMFYPDFGNLLLWKAPDFLVWIFISSCLTFFSQDSFIKILGINGILILGLIYFLHGIAITAFFFERKNIPRLIRICAYSFIAVQQFAMIAAAGLGLFDTWFDFRKLKKG